MRGLAIQFACRKHRTRRLGAVVLALGLGSLMVSTMHFTSMESATQAAEDEVRRLTERAQQAAAAPHRDARPPLPEASVRAIHEAIGQLNLPWRGLFGALESSRPDTVALLSLEPDGRKRTLLVQAEAKTPEHMIAFVERLRSEPAFEYAVLTRHELRDQDPHNPYRFWIQVRWREEL